MIYYIVPRYIKDIGNCSIIRDSKGEHLVKKTLNSALRELFMERCLDLRAIKRRCSSIINQKNIIPLYLSSYEIFVPVRVRIPITSRDGGYGYINYNLVKSLEEKSVLFKDGSSLNILDSKRCIMKRMKMAILLSERFNENKEGIVKGNCSLIYAASREDVLLLIEEISSLRKKVEWIMNNS